MAADQRLPLNRISGSGAAVGDVLVWDGARWLPGEAGASVTVSTTAPSSPATGDLWYDTDDTC